MTRCSIMLSLALGLTGCAGWPSGSPTAGEPAHQDIWPDTAGGAYDFAWHLSGDRAVAPLQVFDNGRDTWLQFQANQALPALFGVRDGAQQLLRYRRLDPYVQVEGVWQELLLRGGALTARAQYQGANQQGRSARAVGTVSAPAPASASASATTPAPAPVSAASAAVQVLPLVPSAQTGTGSATAFVPLPTAPATRAASASAPAVAALAQAAADSTAAAGFNATPADGNIRRALARWAKTARWTFEPEHWTLEVDIPLAGSADFPSDFKQAVRQLLAATELSERPLQPCFYSNRVLRVVPLAQACDRTARHTGAVS